MVEDLLAARGVIVSRETVRRWAEKFGRDFANEVRRRAPQFGDKWRIDEGVVAINGKKCWLWRAVDQDGFVLDALVRSRRDRSAAERLLRKLIRNQARAPRVLVTDKLGSCGAAGRTWAWRSSIASIRGSTIARRIRISQRGGESGS